MYMLANQRGPAFNRENIPQNCPIVRLHTVICNGFCHVRKTIIARNEMIFCYSWFCFRKKYDCSMMLLDIVVWINDRISQVATFGRREPSQWNAPIFSHINMPFVWHVITLPNKVVSPITLISIWIYNWTLTIYPTHLCFGEASEREHANLFENKRPVFPFLVLGR